MAPSDRKPGPDGKPLRPALPSDPPERSSRGKVVIRSSSHPPDADSPITDPPTPPPTPPTEEAVLGDAQRAKKTTPAERPRKRRKVQADQLAREHASATEAELERAAADEQAEADRRLWWVLAGLAVVVGALYWFAR